MSDTTVIIYYVQCLGAAIYRKANQRYKRIAIMNIS